MQANTDIDSGYSSSDEGFISENMKSLFWSLQNREKFSSFTKVKDYKIGDFDMTLYSRERNGCAGLKEFMVEGTVDVKLENLLELVMHVERRTEWDDTYVEHEFLNDGVDNSDVIFSVSRFPFPMAKRTYVIRRTIYRNDDDSVVVYTKVIPYNVPKKYRWSIQVDDFESMLILKQTSDDACYMCCTYYENPKVVLPNTYLNMIIEGLVPRTLEKMLIACKKNDMEQCKEFCKNLQFIPMKQIDAA
ncbi:bifunctional START domain/START-like domain superfamily [Babesia duncani]|uniref:Bifunctional START domain/START-like domain superfamily n=1 Tax=Babesia duncani TaxID=323732 RepID=A0AAD9PPE2_9APIC|nr:bifunctional START domain/START-like domain superfamily [Babesia duncani]